MSFSKTQPPFGPEVINLLDGPVFDGQYEGSVKPEILAGEFVRRITEPGWDVCVGDGGKSLFAGRLLNWDSAHFGKICYRIDYLRLNDPTSDISGIERWLRQQKVDVCFLRLPSSHAASPSLSRSGSFRKVGSKLLFRKKVSAGPAEGRFASVASQNILQLAESHFEEGRFFNDARFDKAKASQVYTEWIANTLRTSPDRLYGLLKDDGALEGFVILNKLAMGGTEFGFLELIAAAKFRSGTGGQLLRLAENELARQNISLWFANTYVTNFSAIALYLKNGFEPYQTIDEYHVWLDAEGGHHA